MICTRPAAPTSDAPPTWLGQPCPECGHTSLVHPGPANPGLDVCVTCQLLDTAAVSLVNQANVRELRARLDKLPPELPQVPGRVDKLQARVDELAAADGSVTA